MEVPLSRFWVVCPAMSVLWRVQEKLVVCTLASVLLVVRGVMFFPGLYMQELEPEIHYIQFLPFPFQITQNNK